MTDTSDDYRQLMNQKRFLGEIEQGIRQTNRTLIHGKIPGLDKEKILSFAVAVARLRARYLAAAVHVRVGEDGAAPSAEYIDDLRHKREMYEEAKTGYEALRDAIEKGYIDIETL